MNSPYCSPVDYAEKKKTQFPFVLGFTSSRIRADILALTIERNNNRSKEKLRE